MSWTDGIVRLVFGQYGTHIPQIKSDLTYRDNEKAVTIFDPATLKTVMVDKYATELLKLVDNRSDISDIARKLAVKCDMHPAISTLRTLQYLSSFQKLGFVSMPVTIDIPVPARTTDKLKFPAPVLVSWEVTKTCNLNCSHCASQIMEGRELDTQEALALIEHMHETGVFMLSFSGGEPLIRPDIFLLLERVRELGMEFGLTTNGTLLDEKIVRKLASLEPFNVHISIDGVGEVHDSFRNMTGVFDKAVNSLRLFKKHGIPHGITTSITRRNVGDLDNIKDFVKQNDIRSWEIFFAIPVGNLEKEEALNSEQFIELAGKIESIRQELDRTRVVVGDSLGYFGKKCIRDEEWNGCTAGINHCSIDAYGNVKGCPVQPSELIEGNVRDKSLSGIWSSDLTFQYNRKDVKLEGYCAKCRHKNACRAGCKTSAFHITGTIKENRMCLHFLDNSNYYET